MSLRHRLRHEWLLLRVAIQFLTRLPVPDWNAWDPDWLTHSMRHLPLVGALVGLLTGAVLLGASLLWPPLVGACLAVVAGVLITGAFHEDGLADTWDGLGGSAPRARALEIMKDSRLGSYGACALMLGLLLRTATLAGLCAVSPSLAAAALVLAHSGGRCAALLVMGITPYGGDLEHARARAVTLGIPARIWLAGLALTAGVWALVALLAPAGLSVGMLLMLLGVLLILAGLANRWLVRRLGGYTGDTLGAVEQVGEILVLLLVLASFSSAR